MREIELNGKYMTVNDIAKKWMCSPGLVYRYIKQGRLHAIHTKSFYIVNVNDVNNFTRRKPGRPRSLS